MKQEKFTLLLGPIPGNPTGLGMAFETLVNGIDRLGIPYYMLDLEPKAQDRKPGSFSFNRFYEIVRIIIKFWGFLPRINQIYLTIGISTVGFLRDFFLIWPAKLIGCRIVVHVHSGGYSHFYRSQNRLMRWFIRNTLVQADSVIVLGKLLVEQFDFLPEISDRISIIPNGLPVGMQPQPGTEKTIVEDQPIRLLYLSNMILEKGYLTVLEACEILHKELRVPFQCDFYGKFMQPQIGRETEASIESHQSFMDQIKRRGLEKVVAFHGVLQPEEKKNVLSESHLFILPTQYLWEGQPISILEAIAYGIPVISTRFRGIPEQVIHGFNGYFVDPLDAGAIAAHVETVFRDPDAYHELSRNAVNHFMRHFTTEKYLSALIDVIFNSQPTTGILEDEFGK